MLNNYQQKNSKLKTKQKMSIKKNETKTNQKQQNQNIKIDKLSAHKSKFHLFYIKLTFSP